MGFRYWTVGVMGAAAVVLAGCTPFRWSGYYSHDDRFPQLHYDWSKDPYFPSPDGGERAADLRFPVTPAEHHEAARRFALKAGSYRSEASAHRKMSDRYSDEPRMEAHCAELSVRYEELAEKMEEFADWHRTEATKEKVGQWEEEQ